jgi:hypothetical protein
MKKFGKIPIISSLAFLYILIYGYLLFRFIKKTMKKKNFLFH